MARVFTYGLLYAQAFQHLRRGAQPFKISTTQETLYPYRSGRCLLVRLGTYGAAIGVWTGRAESEDMAMALAIGARVDDSLFEDDGGLAERFERQLARQNIARSGMPLEDEWEIISALDLLEDAGSLGDFEEDD